MKSGFKEDTGMRAVVVSLAMERGIREGARKLAAECPGWRCWYSAPSGLWFGRRIVERWVPEMTARAYIVLAANAAMLQAVITTQAILDLGIEFADWDIECTPGGYWWAAWNRAEDGWARSVLCEVSAVKLAASLRAYVAGMDEDEPEDQRRRTKG